jgi:hypothetical protein
LRLRKQHSGRYRQEARHRDSCLNQPINDDFSVLLDTRSGTIAPISFFKNHFRFLKEI